MATYKIKGKRHLRKYTAPALTPVYGVSGAVVHAVIDGYGLARGDVLEIRNLLYDFALTSFVMLYVRKIREKLLRSFK